MNDRLAGEVEEEIIDVGGRSEIINI